MIHTIQSDSLRVDINSVGAELFSLYSKNTGEEYLWQGDSDWWAGRAPVLFPIVCSMKDCSYLYDGNAYNMPKHGFALGARFSTAGAQGSKIVFEYSDNDETRKIYPFAFLFQVVFELADNKLITTYRVENHNKCPMYFSLGSHEAYRCPRGSKETFEDYYLEFEKDSTYISEKVTDAGLISGETYTVIDNGRTIPLKYELFANDTLIFKNVPGNKIFLKSKKSTDVVEVNYQDAPNLGIWTKVGAPYICIEPWYGLPDEAQHDGRLENKLGIVNLKVGNEFAWTHSITIHEGL